MNTLIIRSIISVLCIIAVISMSFVPPESASDTLALSVSSGLDLNQSFSIFDSISGVVQDIKLPFGIGLIGSYNGIVTLLYALLLFFVYTAQIKGNILAKFNTAVLIASLPIFLFGFKTTLLTLLIGYFVLLTAVNWLINRNYFDHYLFTIPVILLAAIVCYLFNFILTPLILLIIAAQNIGYPKIVKMLCISSALFYVLNVYVTPPFLPDYPPTARVLTEVDPFSGIDTLVGAAPHIQVRDADRLRVLADGIIFFIVPALLLLSFFLPSILRQYRYYYLILTAGIILNTSYVSSTVALLSPIYAIERIFPQLVLEPLLLLACVVFSMLSFFILLQSKYHVLAHMLSVIFVLVIFYNGKTPLLIDKQSDYSAKVVAYQTDQRDYHRIFNSPSHHLLPEVKKVGFNRLIKPRIFSSIAPQLVGVAASRAETKLKELLLNNRPNPAIRWTSGKGKQLGGEWIELTFSNSIPFDGLALSTGNFYTDFPRGLSIKGDSSCSNTVELSQQKPIFIAPKFRGVIEFTSDSYPYLDFPVAVVVIFKETKSLCRIRIEQIGKSLDYDWSLTSIKRLVINE